MLKQLGYLCYINILFEGKPYYRNAEMAQHKCFLDWSFVYCVHAFLSYPRFGFCLVLA